MYYTQLTGMFIFLRNPVPLKSDVPHTTTRMFSFLSTKSRYQLGTFLYVTFAFGSIIMMAHSPCRVWSRPPNVSWFSVSYTLNRTVPQLLMWTMRPCAPIPRIAGKSHNVLHINLHCPLYLPPRRLKDVMSVCFPAVSPRRSTYKMKDQQIA